MTREKKAGSVFFKMKNLVEETWVDIKHISSIIPGHINPPSDINHLIVKLKNIHSF